jgi:predicted PurR-regulated permease PerM
VAEPLTGAMPMKSDLSQSDAGLHQEAGSPAIADTSRVVLHMPVDGRSVSLVVLATLASVFMLRWASAVFIPVMVGLLFSYALSPVVGWLQWRRIPRALSSAVLVLGIVSGVVATGYLLSDDASKLVELLPASAQKLRQALHVSPGQPDNTLATMQKAAAQIEQAAEETTQATPLGRGVQRVRIERPKFEIRDHLWSGTMGLLAILWQMGMVALITFFLLASGDTFRRKLIKLAGPTLTKKRITLQALNQIHDQIQRYMLVQLFTSALVGVATWMCFWAIGVEHAAVWGIAAGVLDLVPYVGSVVIATGSALVSFLQFGTLEMALLVSAISFAIHFAEAFLLTPWLTSRANKMNPVAIFVGVLAWGWLWGIWGLLLGVPILVVIKAICDRVDDLKPVGEFLGD